MKYLISTLALAAVLFVPNLALAAQFEGAEEYTLTSDRVIDENFYVGGTNVFLSGTVNGDLFAAGSNLTQTGTVGADSTLAAGNVQIIGPTAGDLRVAGGTVIIGGDVGGEVLAAGGMLTVSPETDIAGKTYLAGGVVNMGGTINNDVLIFGDEVQLQGVINGNAVIKAETSLTIGDGAIVTGLLKYEAPDVVAIPSSAQIGTLDFTKISETESMPDTDMMLEGWQDFWRGFGVAFKVLRLLTLIASVLVIFFVFKKNSSEVVEDGLKEFGWDLLRGLVLWIVAPITVIILLFTVVGSGLGIIVAAAYFFALVLARIFGAMLLGFLIFRLFQKKNKEFTWPAALTGAGAFWLLGFIPVVGWLARAVFMLTALGSILYLWYKQVWLKR